MKPYSMKERRDLYATSAVGKKYPASVPYVAADDRLYATWILGNDYRSKTDYWGAYPPNYLERITAVFPDAERVCHLFSGSLPKGNYTRFDRREDIDCDVRGDANDFASYFPGKFFDIIYADPPYTEEDAANYGTCLINRNKVVSEALVRVDVGGFLVWMDMVLPMYRKDEVAFMGAITLIRSTNHRVRGVFLFQKL